MFDLAEATARWGRVRRMMADADIDLLIAVDLTRDEILLGHQRWLTGYIPIGGPAAVLLGRDGSVELVSERIGKPVAEHYRTAGWPIELVNGFSPALLAERIRRRAPRRLGVAEAAAFSSAAASLVREQAPSAALVDVSDAMQRLRYRKSEYELSLIRRSCTIADAVWAQVSELFRVGRRQYEILADVDHLVRSAGAEGGFNLLLPLPFLGRPMLSLANPEVVRADARYLLEISPRYRGYYAQLTLPVTSHADDAAARGALDDVVAAKLAAQPRMRPGADLSEVARFVSAFLADRGRSLTSLSLGHLCGLALEEPRHDPDAPLILEEGMTLIFHPVLADPELNALMRADTYLITPTGAERLTLYDGGLLTVS